MKSLLLVVLLALSSYAAEPLLEKIDLFEGGKDGFASYRIPGIVVTAKGTVLAYCEARKDSKADWGEIEVHLRRSTDGGKTWEPARKIAHTGDRIEGNPRKREGGEHEQTVNNPVAIADKDGTVHLLYCINYARCFYMRSTDDGLTFSAPAEITASFEPFRPRCPWNVLATGPGHGIQLRKTGRLVVPVWLAYGKNPGDHGPSMTGVIYSDNGGHIWKAGDISVPDVEPFDSPNETAVAELSDGRVMLNTRTGGSLPNRRVVTLGPNGATEWGAPRFDPALWEPVCMAGLTAMPNAPSMLVFSNPHNLKRDESGKEIPGSRAERRNLSVKLSRDDGQTWPVNKTLEPGPSAYSDLAVLPDDTILCFYEQGRKITLARFNLDWLQAP
ncbi:MAG: sialidase family protein [Prosthecobacter sp.]|nr:sialidase family protein [Prosthecobacter sp.]